MSKYNSYDINALYNLKNDYKLLYKLSFISMLGLNITVSSNVALIPCIPLLLAAIKDRQIEKGLINNDSVKRINEIYNEILEDIIKLSNTLDNKELLEHYDLLKYIYNNRYMTSGLYYPNSKKDINYALPQTMCLNNHGVCRHTALMDKDYLKKLGFEAEIVAGVSTFNEPLYLNNFIEKILNTEERRERFYSDPLYKKQVIEIVTKELDLEHERPKLIEKIIGNHAITRANDDQFTYYLDITQDTIYVPKKDKILASSEGKEFKIVHDNDLIAKGLYKTKKMNIKSTDTLENMNLILTKEEQKIAENIDLLEKFKQANQEKLIEAQNIYLKLMR